MQVELKEYEINLSKIIEVTKSMADKTIWVGLTPVIDEIHNSRKEGFLRYNNDVIKYDTAARKIMKELKIPCIDMYNFIRSLGEDVYSDYVHFTNQVRKLHAAFIAGYLSFMVI